jgi:hypothetical protein
VRSSYLPSSVSSTLRSFAPCFSAPSFENFVALVVGWIVVPGRRWISRAVSAARLLGLGRKHHSTLYRFLSRSRWCPDLLGAALFRCVLRFLPSEIVVLVDDTMCPRKGRKVFGVGLHVDLANSVYQGRGRRGGRIAFALGVDWVILAVWVPLPWNTARGLALPLLVRLYRTRRTCPPAKYRKRTELAREMLQLLVSWLPEGRSTHVTSDREYACGPVLKGLPSSVLFSGPMDPKAALFSLPSRRKRRGRPQRKGRRLPTPSQMAKKGTWESHVVQIYGCQLRLLVQSVVCLWPTVTGYTPVRVLITRDPRGRYQDRVYFSLTVDRSVAEILAVIARRWEIEVLFRSAKQSFGLTEPQNGWSRGRRTQRTEAAGRRTVPLILIAYGTVQCWYLENGQPARDLARARRARPWQRQKTSLSFEDMLQALQREIWQHRIIGGRLRTPTPMKTLARRAVRLLAG